MKKVLSALAKLIPYIPLIIFLMTIFYGLLHIDFGDSPDSAHSSYGWFFLFWFYLPTLAIYIFSLLANLIRGVQYLLKGGSKVKISLSIAYMATIVLIGWALFASQTVLIFGFYVVQRVAGWSFIFLLLLLPFFDRLYQKDGLSKKSNQLILVCLLIGTILPMVYSKVQTKLSDNVYTKQLEQFYRSKGLKYDVTMKEHWFESDRAFFKVTDEGVDLLVTAEYSGKKLEKVDFVNESYGLNILLGISAGSQDGQAILKEFKSAVEKAVKKSGGNAKVRYDKELSYNRPQFSMSTNYQLTSVLQEKAAQNRKSKNSKKRAFNGYAAISIKDYIKEGALMPELELEDGAHMNWEEEADFSKLPDGTYIVDAQPYVVSKGKIISRPIKISRQSITAATEKEASSSSSDYYDIKDIKLKTGREKSSSSIQALQAIQNYLKADGQDLAVKIISPVTAEGERIAVLKQGNLQVPAKFKIENGKVTSSTFSNFSKPYDHALLMRSVVETKEAKDFLNQYWKVFANAASQTKYSKKIKQLPQKISLTYTGYGFLNMTDTALQKAQAFKNSPDKKQSAFNGLGGLTIKDLVAAEVLVPMAYLDIPNELLGDNYENYQLIRNEVSSKIDGSQLPDGIYAVDINMIRVKDGKVTLLTVEEVSHSELIELPSSQDFDDLSQEEWKENHTLKSN